MKTSSIIPVDLNAFLLQVCEAYPWTETPECLQSTICFEVRQLSGAICIDFCSHKYFLTVWYLCDIVAHFELHFELATTHASIVVACHICFFLVLIIKAAFLPQMECDIAFLAKALNNVSVSKHFTRAADARRRAFEAILWNGGMGQWLDYWLPSQKTADMRKVTHKCRGPSFEATMSLCLPRSHYL